MKSNLQALRNPFSDSAGSSVRTHSYYSDRSIPSVSRQPKRRLESYRLRGDYERPWADDNRQKSARYGNYIIYGFIALGFILSALVNFLNWNKVPIHQYCLVLDDQFSSLDPAVWSHEIQTGGFGAGAFDWTTADKTNIYVDHQGLHIVPTLTNQTTSITNADIFNGHTLNLTKAGGDGSCTGTTNEKCSVRSNSTLKSIIPPVRSARITTEGKKSIRYGRVEVVAKLPQGDWIWPAIWMLPVNQSYGTWPASGEIDIVESRGNGVDYPLGGRDVMSSAIHWGPTPETDAFWRSTRGKSLRRSDFSKEYHTFGLEWSETYLYTYLDSRLYHVMDFGFDKGTTMWQKGHFDGQTVNSSLLTDPWSQANSPNAPFNEPFFLILNVAVGGTNNYFPDGVGGKPWVDDGNAAWDFYNRADQWLPTWPKENDRRGMTVKSVKMWQQGPCS